MSFGPETAITNETLQETVHLRRHSCGLPVYFCEKPGFQKRYACFATHFGSIDSKFSRGGRPTVEVPDGVAHFLEHKLFEGPDGNAMEEFSKSGAASNAYTSFNTTNYLFSCAEGFPGHLERLVRFVQQPHFTEENVEKEKGIIGQEIRMYEDSAGWRVYFNLLESLYRNHPVRKDIAGTVESIAGITPELLMTCYETFYHPENMILFAIGDEDREGYFELVDRILSEREWEPLGRLDRVFPEEPVEIADRRREERMVVSMPRLLMGFKDVHPGLPGKDLLTRELSADILLELIFGQATAFHQSLYESQLIDDGFGASHSAMADVGHSMIGGETPHPERLEEAVLREIERVRRDGIDSEGFERQKRAIMGSFIRYFNSLEFTANHYCSYQFLGIDLLGIIDGLHALELSDLQRLCDEHLDPSRVATSLILLKEGTAA